MTTPQERTRSVLQTREFLEKLLDREQLPLDVRREALCLLRHYPFARDLDYAAAAFPETWAPVCVPEERRPSYIELLGRLRQQEGIPPRRVCRHDLAQKHRRRWSPGPGLLFLDFDDVICTNTPYGGYDLVQSFESRPDDLYERLWHPPAVEVLLHIQKVHAPRVVVTSSWLRLMERDGCEDLFRRTGLDVIADALHVHWEAPAMTGMTRLDAIERWLSLHYRGEPLVILDDDLSGTGLKDSRFDRAGRVVLCRRDVGLTADHLPLVSKALGGEQDGIPRRVTSQRRRK